MNNLKVFKCKVCQMCGLSFQPVDWMPWRRSTFCSEQCVEKLAHDMGEREPESDDLSLNLFPETTNRANQ